MSYLAILCLYENTVTLGVLVSWRYFLPPLFISFAPRSGTKLSFMVFHVFIWVHGVSTVEKFLPAHIYVYSIYCCKVLPMLSFLNHWNHMSHVIGGQEKHRKAWRRWRCSTCMREGVFAQTCLLSNEREEHSELKGEKQSKLSIVSLKYRSSKSIGIDTWISLPTSTTNTSIENNKLPWFPFLSCRPAFSVCFSPFLALLCPLSVWVCVVNLACAFMRRSHPGFPPPQSLYLEAVGNYPPMCNLVINHLLLRLPSVPSTVIAQCFQLSVFGFSEKICFCFICFLFLFLLWTYPVLFCAEASCFVNSVKSSLWRPVV